MPGQIPTGDIHHLRLTVTDLARSLQFYTSLLGFQVAVESPPSDDPAAAEVFRDPLRRRGHDPGQPAAGLAADGAER